MRTALLAILALLGSGAPMTTAQQTCSADLGELVGWTIAAVKTIDGEFQGCEFNRVISFTDGSQVRCMSYNYTYSYMPDAVLFARSIVYKGTKHTLIKMCVEDELYDVSPD